jgi:hypothetical protein
MEYIPHDQMESHRDHRGDNEESSELSDQFAHVPDHMLVVHDCLLPTL